MPLSVMSSANVYFVRDGKILLSRRSNTGWRDGELCAPGGHIEAGETPRQGMHREIMEELAIKVEDSDLQFLCVASRKVSIGEYVAFEFVVTDEKYKPKNAEPEKCSELVWVDPENLPDDVIDDFRIIIEEGYNKGKNYLEIGY